MGTSVSPCLAAVALEPPEILRLVAGEVVRVHRHEEAVAVVLGAGVAVHVPVVVPARQQHVLGVAGL